LTEFPRPFPAIINVAIIAALPGVGNRGAWKIEAFQPLMQTGPIFNIFLLLHEKTVPFLE